MKQFAFALIIAISGAAFGQIAKPKGLAKPVAKPISEIKCPVMPSHKANIAKATKDKLFADYKGRRYYFCCAGCPEAFKANPSKYAKADSLPTPKPPAPRPAPTKPKIG